MSNKIFISYARLDSEFVLKLTNNLNQSGNTFWIDQINIDPGKEWDEEVENALSTSEIILVVLSSRSVDSPNVMNEVAFAIDEGKKIIPVKIEECKLPLLIKRFEYIDFTYSFEKGLTRLKISLDKLLADKNISTSLTEEKIVPPPVIPAKPINYKIWAGVVLAIFIVVIITISRIGATSGNEEKPSRSNDSTLAPSNMPNDSVTVSKDSATVSKDSVTVYNPFSISPEEEINNPCVASLTGSYEVHPNYIDVFIDEGYLLYRNHDATGTKLTKSESFESLRIGIFKSIPNQKNSETKGMSNPHVLGKVLKPGEKFQLESFKYRINTIGIKNLDLYKFYVEILVFNEDTDPQWRYMGVPGLDFINIEK